MARAQSGKKHYKATEKYCSYLVEILDWELTYSFLLNPNPKIFPGQYSEHLYLEIKGSMRSPEKYAGDEINSTFIGDREIFPLKNESDFRPRCVGAITLRGERRDFLGSLPFDSLPIITSLMETKQIRFFDLHGLIPKYGRAYINSIGFFREYNPDDY